MLINIIGYHKEEKIKNTIRSVISKTRIMSDQASLGASLGYSFKAKNIIITGAAGNFGREGCKYFVDQGAFVVGMDKEASKLNETLEYVASKHAEMIECDVTNTASVDSSVEQALKFFQRKAQRPVIDFLWNNAGYQGQIAPTLDYDPKDFANVMNINVTGMFIMLQAVAKKMSADGGNNRSFSIVNTASVAGLRGTPAMVAYSSSKAAVLALTVCCAKDLAPYGIRVNAVSPALIGPGYMWTRQNELHAACGSPYFSSNPEAVAEAKIASVPMKRLGTVEEVLKSVAFLFSDHSSYTTATNLVVDGGMSGGLKA